MREAIAEIDKEITRTKRNFEMEGYARGYVAGLIYAKDIINKHIDTFLVEGKTYFVILYEDGNIYLPYIKEMKLYHIKKKGKKQKIYCFSDNLEATNSLNAGNALEIGAKQQIRKRVFLTREQADKAMRRVRI